jgi:hypothetical protein
MFGRSKCAIYSSDLCNFPQPRKANAFYAVAQSAHLTLLRATAGFWMAQSSSCATAVEIIPAKTIKKMFKRPCVCLFVAGVPF